MGTHTDTDKYTHAHTQYGDKKELHLKRQGRTARIPRRYPDPQQPIRSLHGPVAHDLKKNGETENMANSRKMEDMLVSIGRKEEVGGVEIVRYSNQ
jgi:hypothetical protein